MSAHAVPQSPKKKLQVMSLTDAAADRIRAIMAGAPQDKPVLGLRVGVKKGGCAGLEYTMEFATDKKPFEDVIEDKGATVLIDPAALMYLLGTRMDYKTEKMSATFVFENPNQTSACGCGESIAINPVKREALEASAG